MQNRASSAGTVLRIEQRDRWLQKRRIWRKSPKTPKLQVFAPVSFFTRKHLQAKALARASIAEGVDLRRRSTIYFVWGGDRRGQKLGAPLAPVYRLRRGLAGPRFGRGFGAKSLFVEVAHNQLVMQNRASSAGTVLRIKH